MSYLPRMSKTYKEPEERKHEDGAKEITFNSIPIASALPDDRAYNPQTVLKQYNFYPHPPPQLPGPSLIEEAEQNEKLSVDAKRRRTREESIHVPDEGGVEEFPYETGSKTVTINVALTPFEPLKVDDAVMAVIPAKTVRMKKVPDEEQINLEKELDALETTNSIDEDKQRTTENQLESISSPCQKRILKKGASEAPSANVCIESEGTIRYMSSNESYDKINTAAKSGFRNFEIVASEKRSIPQSLIHQGVQCYPQGLNEKTFTMPCSVHNLMKTLSFLVLELDGEEYENRGTTKEVKKLLKQINQSIFTLLGCHTISGYTLQTSISDLKRLEKINSDLEEYIKLVYGEKGKFGCKSEEKKKIYCELSQKDYELKFLHEKLREGGIQDTNTKFMNCTIKSPEVVLQNKNLENEQLTAEIEFNNEELKRFQQALAGKNWEIYKSKEEIVELKTKMAISKSRSKK